MTDKIESKGKTVKDAVNEALLRMGARKDEVLIEVLDEPKGGLFGILGGKQARVLVTRKKPRNTRGRRDFRDPEEDNFTHDLSATGGQKGRGGGRGRRNQPSAKRDTDNDSRRRDSGRNSGSGRQARSSDRPAADRSADRSADRPGNRPADRPGNRPDNRADAGQSTDSKSGGRQARPDRNDGPRQPRENEQAGRGRSRRRGGRSRRNADQQVERPAQVDAVERNESAPEPSRSPRGRNENQDSSRNERSRGRGGRGRGRDDRNDRGNRDNRDNRNSAAADDNRKQHPTSEQNMTPDEILVAGIKATKYADPLRGVAEENLDETLCDLTSGMLIRAGFPVRCEVKPGEYRQVRIITDDSSAGMLIGRHGATVDSIEHLVDRMAGMAAGDRVRMNLDINNYRRRREEALHDRVVEAAAVVLENGRTYHMEPMSARERRIVHLEVEKMAGIRTFTMGGSSGKHVVLAPDNGDKENRTDDQAETTPNGDQIVAENTKGYGDDMDDLEDDGPQPETNELVVDDDDHRPLI